MTKKIISLLLVLAMLLSLMGFAAADNAVSSTDPTVIYTDNGSNHIPAAQGYVKNLTLSGASVEEVSSTSISGSTVTLNVALDGSVPVGSTWTVKMASSSDWVFNPAPNMAPWRSRTEAGTDSITWNADNTADQVYTVTTVNGSVKGTWNIHYYYKVSAAVQDVIALIDAIGEVTRESGDAITAARTAYDALTEDEKAAVTNYAVLTAAEARFAELQGDYTVLDAPVLDASAAVVSGTAVTLAAPAASAQDAAATVEYRMSADSETWGAWQTEPGFTGLSAETDYWFQARYVTSDLVHFENSPASAAIKVTTLEPSVVTVSNYTEFCAAYTGAATDGTETVIRLTADVHMSKDGGGVISSPNNAHITIEGAGGGLYVNEDQGSKGFNIGANTTLTLRNLTCGLIRHYENFIAGQNSGVYLFKANGTGITVNVDNVRFYNDMNKGGGLLSSAIAAASSTVNVYSFVNNASVFGYAFLFNSSCTLNLLPRGDIRMTSANADVTSGMTNAALIPQAGYEIKSGATRSGTAWTAMSAETLADLNAGGEISLAGVSGYALNVTDAPAVPAAFTAPVVAEEGTPEAETADVVYTIGNTSVSFTYRNRQSPQGASFPMIYGYAKVNNSVYANWRAYSDKSDGLEGNGSTFTFTGLPEDTAYTYRVGWFSLESGWNDVVVDVPVRTSYTVHQLNAPVLSDQVEKTSESVELTAAATTQDTGAKAFYRVSADGETWGEWQESTLFEGLSAGTTYYFQAYFAAADYHWSDSEPSAPLEITTKALTLTAPVLDASAATADAVSVTLAAPAASEQAAEAQVEYQISADGETWGEWQTSNVFTGLSPKTAYFFRARYLAPSAAWISSEPSEAITVTTTKDPNAPIFTVSGASGQPGSEVQVEISMANNPGIVYVGLELNYDREKLELVGVTDAGLLPGYTGGNSTEVYPYAIYWEASTAETNLTVNGKLATATFRIKDGTEPGEARVWLTYSPNQVYDHDLTNVDFDTEEGVVTVEAAPYVPVDSQIDLEDYVLQAMGRDFEKITGATVNALVDSYTEDPETKTVRVILNESVPLDAELTWTFAHEALTDFGIDPEETGLTATLVDGMATMVPTITVLGSAASYTVHFVRSDKIVAAESITLDKTELTFDLEHTTEQLTATVLPENAFDKTVTWTTSDNSVALVDNNGLVRSVSVGTATITAACGELTATCEVTVTEAVYVPVDSQIDLEDFNLYYSGTPFGTVTGATVNAFVDAYSQDGDTVRVVLNKSVPLDAELTWTYNGSTSHVRLVLKDRDNTLTLADGQGTMHPVVDMVQTNNNNTRDSKTLTVIFVRSDKVVAAESVTLDKTSISFDRDHTLEQLTAAVLPEETFIKAVTWTSSDESVATVDENGLVRSVAVGTATITAACGEASATCAVSVTVAPYIPTPSQIDLEDRNFEKYGMCPFTMTGATVSDKVDSYTVDEATKTVRVILNEEVPLGAEVTWTYGGDYPSSYSWMNPSLNQSGNVVTLVDGCGTMDAVLQVNSSNYGDLGSVTYHVIFARSDKVVAATGIELDKTALTLTVNGASEQLTATVLPENAFDKSVTWTTSDENVATVDQTGLVKPVGAGTATITVSQGELQATCAVEVRFVEVTGISLSETEVNLSVGGVGVNVTANLEPENASDKTVTWTLEGEDYARISASGARCTIYPKAEGDAVLTATTANGQTATCAIHVAYVTVESVVLDRYEVIMSTTGSELVKGSVEPGNASTQTLDWSNDNPDVVSFSVQRMISSGKSSYNCTLSPKAEGTANITVSSPDGPSAICVVKVYYVADVIDTIDALPERVTRDDADAVNAAKALYDALNDEAKTLVTNADKLQAALDALASFEGTDPATMAAPSLSAESAVVGYQTVTLTATGEPADSTAVIEYRVSPDGESWSKWQTSGEFKNLRPNTTHYYQARFAAGDVVNYLDSEPCETVAIMNKAPATTTVEVADWTELKNAMQGAATDGTETVIRLTKTVIRNYDLRTDSITVPDGAIIVLTAAEGAALVNAGTSIAIKPGTDCVITLKDMVCANITEADRRGLNTGVYSARLFSSGKVYTANVDNTRMISGITYGVFAGNQGTVNFYSGVITNPVYDCMNTNDNRPIEAVTRVNLIPYSDLALEGDLKDVKDKIFFAPIVPISAVFTQTANLGTYTALTAGKVELLNAGGQFPASGIFGIRVLTNGNTAPAPFAELTIAEEGTPEAETADVTYVRSETQMVFTVKNKPANSVFFIKSSSYPYGNGYYYAWPDGGEGSVYTVPGMRSDTAYTIKLMLASLDTAYTNVESVHELRSTYTAVQLDAPVLTDNAAITDTAVTLEAPAASAQDAKAIIKYRMSADGETWGDWQESPAFEGLAPSTAYSFQAMYAAGDDHWSDSEASNTVTLTTKAKVLDAPVLTEAAADVNSVTVTAPAASAEDASATVQYRISADGETWGDWQDEATFTGLAPKTTYYVQARYYAVSENYQNSEPSQALAVTTEKDPTAPVFAVSSVSGAPGSEVQVEISMANNPGIVAASLELNYDRDKLELVKVENAGLLPNYTGGNSTAVYPYTLYWEASTAEANLTVNGLLATATFRIKDEAATGDDAKVWITYDPDNVYDYSMNNVTFDTEEGAVAITDGYAVTLVDRAAEAATTLTSGLYAGELSFTVTNDQACVVLTKDEAGSYTVLRAVPVGDPATTNTYSFTVNVDKPLTVIIAVKGDVDLSGAVGLDDWSLVARSLLTPGIRAHLYLSDEQTLIGDLSGDGAVGLEDYSLIARSLLSKTARAYETIKW